MEARKESNLRAGDAPTPSARFLERLDGGLRYRLTLVIAPAKSGKTELLQQWAQALSKRKGHRPAWVSLNATHNTPESFLAALVAALQIELEEVAAETEPGGAFILEDSTIELINRLAEMPDMTVIILDHYHLITAAAIHTAVRLMLDYLPPQAHLVIASQSEPPLPIARLRVRRQVLELITPPAQD